MRPVIGVTFEFVEVRLVKYFTFKFVGQARPPKSAKLAITLRKRAQTQE